MKKLLKRFFIKNRNAWLLRKLNRFSTILYKLLNCEGIVEDFHYNGEAALLRKLSRFVNCDSVVLDVGANVGDWAEEWLSCDTKSRLYCFEIVPPVYNELSSRLSNNSRVNCLPFGLSDTTGETKISYMPSSNSGSSLNVLPWAQKKEEVEVWIKKGDDFVKEKAINEIFFLKIDTEGHEMNVLKGFEEMFKNKKVINIQFEYGYTYIPNRVFLADLYSLLSGYGFVLGRIYPEGVKFSDYDIFRDDDFRMKNYFATLDQKVVELLRI